MGQIGPSTPDLSALARKSDIPTAATSAPPPVADSSATGTGDTVYALANHTHAFKGRKTRMTSNVVHAMALEP